jgi:hypothetical protein
VTRRRLCVVRAAGRRPGPGGYGYGPSPRFLRRPFLFITTSVKLISILFHSIGRDIVILMDKFRSF